MDKAAATAILCQHGYETPLFSLAGRSLWARVVHVYDGDTLTLVAVMGGGEVCRFRCRVYGIDASELTGVDRDSAAHGRRARDRLVQLVTGSDEPYAFTTRKALRTYLCEGVYLVWIECFQLDRYGRTVASVRSDPTADVTFGDILLSEKLARPYDGSRRRCLREERSDAAHTTPSTPDTSHATPSTTAQTKNN